ncbi:MAG: hypothetical protein JNK25_03220 [Phycisphaerae bacterium]|nr:hypothetical protein [Phycisphaerae bacterium]
MRPAPSTFSTAALAALTALHSATVAQPTGCITIPPPAGLNTHSTVSSVSADGRSAVGGLIGDSIVAYTWEYQNGRCVQVMSSAREYSFLSGISADGASAAGLAMPDDSRINEGYAWHGAACADMRSPGLDWLPGPRNFITNGLSGDGSTVYGTISDDGVTGAAGAFLWRPALGEVVELDLMPQHMGRFIILLGSMNADYTGDRIVGTLYGEGFITSAAVWDRHGAGRLLPSANGTPSARSFADGISRNGRFIAGAQDSFAAIWKNEQPPVLFRLGSSNESSTLWMIADHGRMGIGWHAGFVAWTREHGAAPVATYLAQRGAPIPDGWSVYVVSSISDDGSVVAGTLRRLNPTRYLGFIAYTNYRPCFADFNNDGGVDGPDVDAFFRAWESGDADADVNLDGGTDGGDVERFFTDWEAGGCS